MGNSGNVAIDAKVDKIVKLFTYNSKNQKVWH